MDRPNNHNIQALSARWVLPITHPPMPEGVVVIEEGKISSVLERQQFAKNFPDKSWQDYGDAIILPGLINLHTHLDYSALQHFDSQSGLIPWISKLVAQASSWSANKWRDSALAGAKKIALSGTSCVADSSYKGTASWALAQLGLRGIVGLELFGLHTDSADSIWQNWLAKYNGLSHSDDSSLSQALHSGLVQLTVAPHAPYTVCPAIWQRAANWAYINKLPILAHVAESVEECSWIANSQVQVDQLLRQINPQHCLDSTLSWRGKGHSPISHLASHGLLNSQTIAAHTVHLTQRDIALLADNQVKVAHCPRSNARLRNGIAPIIELIEANIPLGFG
ncbi:MAG: amidohydrolase family protein, partial [Candidatus Melainabacteria bacterium]|nr:amidohydrolase family protein [Candidatus Melainabacteria bacterium]